MHKPIFILTMNQEFIPSPEDVLEMVSNHYDYVTETKSYTIDNLRNQLSDMFGTVREKDSIFTVKKEQIEKYLKKIATKIRSHTRNLEFDNIEFWKNELLYEKLVEDSSFVIDNYYQEGYEFATYLLNRLNNKGEVSFTYEAVYDTHY